MWLVALVLVGLQCMTAPRPEVCMGCAPPCLHKQSTRKLHRTWDSSTEVSPRPEIPAVVWTGALRATPLDAGPHSETDPDPIPWPTRCSTVRSPTPPEGIGFKKERKGQVLSGGQSVSGWVGGQRQENCLNIGDANKS